MAALRHTNGVDQEYTYKDYGPLDTLTITDSDQQVLYDADLSLDDRGHLDELNALRSDGTSLDESFDYHDLGYLTDASHTANGTQEDFSYSHDADGNLLHSEEMQIAEYDYDFDEIGALQSVTPEGGSAQPVEFDEGGHLTEVSGLSMEYDARGRLKSVKLSSGDKLEMVYDYRGARVIKRKLDGDDLVVGETHYVDELYEDRDGEDTAYVMVRGQFVGVLTEDDERHLHPDYRGSITLITAPDGSVDADSWFSPYGADAETSGSLVSRRFTGAVYDEETGLVYLNQRYYSPVLGRFLTPDPMYLQQPERSLKTPIEKNLYLYAASNPVEYVDPTGNFIGLSTAALVGAVAGGIAGAYGGARHHGVKGGFVGGVAGLFAGAGIGFAVGLTGSLLSASWASTLTGGAVGVGIGAVSGGVDGALKWGAYGAALGMNLHFGSPGAILQIVGIVRPIRHRSGYKSLAGWQSWFTPASWPGHAMGAGVFMAYGFTRLVGGSDFQHRDDELKFNWRHGEFQVIHQYYGGEGWLPGVPTVSGAYNLAGFSFFEDPAEYRRSAEHETGHMLSNFAFGFWQGVINPLDRESWRASYYHRLFEGIAESHVSQYRGNYDSGFWGRPEGAPHHAPPPPQPTSPPAGGGGNIIVSRKPG